MAEPTGITPTPPVPPSTSIREVVSAAPAAGNGAAPEFQPQVPDHVVMPEFTAQALIVGAVLGIIFGASSLYLVLKVGLTVSASVPIAVLSITLFRAFSTTFGFRRATIMENNIV
jgi:OPT oligopeptide transporter protein